MPKNKKNTYTSSFGVSGRYGHDATMFYSSNLYQDIDIPVDKQDLPENHIDIDNINTIFLKSSENMSELPDNSVHLMITSPPYNVSKDYDDNLTLQEYLCLLNNVFKEVHRVLISGGRACINIANVGRKPYIPLTMYVNQIMIDIGFYMRGEIIWNKAASSGGSCAWGSWMSANNPSLRDIHEYLLIFCKGRFDRKPHEKTNTVGRDEFLEFTKSIWTFNTQSAKKIGHPAPFPVELPYRLIQLYSYTGDIVLDPFCGSGTTCIASIKTKRNYIGYEINEKYVNLANDRIDACKGQTNIFEFFQDKVNIDL